MRFRKGIKVEVMNKNEIPISWRLAEIVSGNGHTYNVKYDYFLGITSKVGVVRVPRKAIRPCAPPVEGAESWLAGDVVEFFDDNSWKIATISKVLGGDYYLIRPLGLTQEFGVYKSRIRMRQSWQNDKWVVMGKGPASRTDVKSNKFLASSCNQKVSFQVQKANEKINLQPGADCVAVKDEAGLQESHVVSSRTLKRASPYCSSLLEAYTGNIQKTRAIEKEGRCQRIVPTPLLGKVHAVACPRCSLGEKDMHASFKNRSNGYYEMERERLSDNAGCHLTRSPEPNDIDSDQCSVGSCSITSWDPNKLTSRIVTFPCQDTVTLCSGAESFCNSGEEEENCSLPLEEEVAESIHKLELQAYCCTLEALHASGPLSWEQEALLTNLRITLHISNDEHLMEIRNLISSGTGIHYS